MTLYYYNELNGRFKAIEEKNIYTISNTYSEDKNCFFNWHVGEHGMKV